MEIGKCVSSITFNFEDFFFSTKLKNFEVQLKKIY